MNQTSRATYLPGSIEFNVFEARPGFGVVLLPDAPKYTLVAVSRDFVRTTGMTKKQVIGKGHFEVYPFQRRGIDKFITNSNMGIKWRIRQNNYTYTWGCFKGAKVHYFVKRVG